MKFWKMNGAGNDFILLNNLEEHLPEEEFPRLARKLCERHLSIGADGFMAGMLTSYSTPRSQLPRNQKMPKEHSKMP